MSNPYPLPEFTSLESTYRLSNGVEIPVVGFGTWQTPNGQTAVDAVTVALEAGYRHIDTATGYGNETSVGQAIARSGIPRDQIFVTSKLDNKDHGYDATVEGIDASLERLGLDYLDLYLIHWPNPRAHRHHWAEANAGTWRAFEEAYEDGRIRALGISNFRRHHIERLLETAKVTPHVNQIRLCPGETPEDEIAYNRSLDIVLEAYSPLGTGKIFDLDVMQKIADAVDRSVAQVALRWSLQRGFLPLPKSVTPERIRANAALFDFALTDAQMAKIDGLEPGIIGVSADPDTTDF